MIRHFQKYVLFASCVVAMVCSQPTFAQDEQSNGWQKNETYRDEAELTADTIVFKQVQHLEEDNLVFSVAKPSIDIEVEGASNEFVPPQKIIEPMTPFGLPPEDEEAIQGSLSPAPSIFNNNDNDFVGFNKRKVPDFSPGDEEAPITDLIWWPSQVDRPFDENNHVETATSDGLLHMSLIASPRIQAISKDPLIREAQIIEADAEFDPTVFTRNLFEDRTDPVGNTLTTGGAEFLRDHIFTSDTGIRRKLRTGADVEISQRLGFQNSNSQFFIPQDQGTATLAINVSQPLLRGGGKYYNRLQILLAQSAGEVAWEVFSSELQDELQRVLSAYWQLYFDRSNFLQKQRNVARGQKILDTLIQRSDLDSLPSQIARARSAVQARKTDLANAYRNVRNAETNIRRFVGDENWLAKQTVEILPIERPTMQDLEIPLQKIVYTALENRPEIREVANRTKIAALQKDISTNELLPDLSLLMGTYVSGLEGDTGIERAWVEQFSNTTPGYSMGLEFEIPYRNRAARSRLEQSQLQLQKLNHELKENIQRVIAESQIAYRRVKSAIQTLKAAYVSIEAANQDLEQQQERFKTFALIEGDLADGQSPTTILDQLLDSQERLTAAESVYAQSVLELQVSSIALNRATGTLLLHQRVSFERCDEDCSPSLRLYQSVETEFDDAASIFNDVD